jgi:hypothetical protein
MTMSSAYLDRDHAMRVILKHKSEVARVLGNMAGNLITRGRIHDDSKFSSAEFNGFVQGIPKLEAATYGSPEYTEALESIKPTLQKHYASNCHHPEFYGEAGIQGMSLLTVLEMVADWYVACSLGGRSSFQESLAVNFKRFGISVEMQGFITRTAREMGLL